MSETSSQNEKGKLIFIGAKIVRKSQKTTPECILTLCPTVEIEKSKDVSTRTEILRDYDRAASATSALTRKTNRKLKITQRKWVRQSLNLKAKLSLSSSLSPSSSMLLSSSPIIPMSPMLPTVLSSLSVHQSSLATDQQLHLHLHKAAQPLKRLSKSYVSSESFESFESSSVSFESSGSPSFE